MNSSAISRNQIIIRMDLILVIWNSNQMKIKKV